MFTDWLLFASSIVEVGVANVYSWISGLIWASTTGAGFLFSHVPGMLATLLGLFWGPRFSFSTSIFKSGYWTWFLSGTTPYFFLKFLGFSSSYRKFVPFLLIFAELINLLFIRIPARDVLCYFLPLICGELHRLYEEAANFIFCLLQQHSLPRVHSLTFVHICECSLISSWVPCFLVYIC